MAFAADTVSITVLEIVDNGFILLVPAAMELEAGWAHLPVEPRRRPGDRVFVAAFFWIVLIGVVVYVAVRLAQRTSRERHI